MAKHVEMMGGRVEIATVTTAPEFRVKDDDRVMGDIRISRGGAFWRARNAQSYLHLTWEQLDELFKQHGSAKSVGEYNHAPPPPASFDEF